MHKNIKAAMEEDNLVFCQRRQLRKFLGVPMQHMIFMNEYHKASVIASKDFLFFNVIKKKILKNV